MACAKRKNTKIENGTLFTVHGSGTDRGDRERESDGMWEEILMA